MMNHFVERLPWRIAALAGLVVGGISLAVGTDIWQSLLRVGEAFAVFGLGGLGLRALLQQGAAASAPPKARPGAHIDQTTPPMSVEDIGGGNAAAPTDAAGPGTSSRGDESRT